MTNREKAKSLLLLEIRLALVGFFLSLSYESVHSLLYVFVDAPTVWIKIYYIIHCSAGDLNPFLLSYHVVALFKRDIFWIRKSFNWKSVVIFIAIAITYTVIAEIIYVEVKQAWAYKSLMPIVPILNVGLTPFIQWMIVAPIALWLAHKWQNQGVNKSNIR